MRRPGRALGDVPGSVLPAGRSAVVLRRTFHKGSIPIRNEELDRLREFYTSLESEGSRGDGEDVPPRPGFSRLDSLF